ncbi:hypothetical protein B0A48_12444 [Cryoendolithus antarcticus]|uniref:Potassium transport protein n=1 Tax=Cryoendolithus antarcticus TaxID=1507870 RepID=A0A1V8SSI6_9PEZI|nr:hypothetical protein B0A48_12444 [Cryoendolithus antarcticus]
MVILGMLKRPMRYARIWLPPLNFITIHYLYFLATCTLATLIFWGSSTPARSVSVVDSIFLVTSAMTLAGLNTVNLSTLNTFQQFMLFFLIIIGSAIFVSAFIVHIRRSAFEKKFKVITRAQRDRSRERRIGPPNVLSGLEQQNEQQTQVTNQHNDVTSERSRDSDVFDEKPMPATHLTFEESRHDREASRMASYSRARSGSSRRSFVSSLQRGRRPSFMSFEGVGVQASGLTRSPTIARLEAGETMPDLGIAVSKDDQTPAARNRNSQFTGLSALERERLGGHEYRAICLLSWLVPAYFILWQLLGALGCAAWVAINRPETARSNGLNPWWVGAFNAISAFNNSGMSLLDANMTAFQTGYHLLITMSLLILAGNTCYPVFLRLIVWTMLKLVSRLEGEAWHYRAETLQFLLDHPRRCYTNLFPSQHTWWLLLSVVTLNGIDWAAFEILNIGNNQITDALPVNVRVIDGLFQAFAVRSGGFYVVIIPTVRISLQVLYVIMMYISVYPVVITMRNSNVYEERSLGIYAENDPEGSPEEHEKTQSSSHPGLLRRATSRMTSKPQQSNALFIRHQLRAQLAHDLWIIAVALFLIMIIEGHKFAENPAVYSVFNFLFEIVSGYGCVGISTGVPWDAYSFCGSWQTGSKLILCVVMLRGRHRGLPVAIDRAVLLPGEDDEVHDTQDTGTEGAFGEQSR